MLELIAILLFTATPLIPEEGEPLVITRSVTLEKNAVLEHGLVIRGSNITVNGNGATLEGPGTPGDRDSMARAGIGIKAEGCSRVTIRNVKVRGFEIGLWAEDGEGWIIENCDFSGNYHDPEYGWGDGRRNGGIILTRIARSSIRDCRANNVWNGLDLWECRDLEIEKNDFSHCSNVCLKLWESCGNIVSDNNLSYGLRIRPGEVHARDSTCVLIESGSNDNRFERNDITHGGDGVFIRVLNGWCSTGNVFRENDCSFANNNGFEAWSPGNTYIDNRANHCSYGFWLGGSDRTVLIGNEAAFNGLPGGFHNAPESDFDHGGIVIVHGSGSHSIIDGNFCHHNNGGGIVVRGDLATRGAKWKMFHLVVQRNRLENNRWGFFARFADWIDFNGNTARDNEKEDLIEEVARLTRCGPAPDGVEAPKAILDGPSRAPVGKKVIFKAIRSRDPGGRPLEFHWDLGGEAASGRTVSRVFSEPGFYRVGLTVSNGPLSDLASIDFYAVDTRGEPATERNASRWGWTMGQNSDGKGDAAITDSGRAIEGRKSILFRPDPYKGAETAALFPKTRDAGWDLSKKERLCFWIGYLNPNNGFQGPNPIVRLHSKAGALSYVPALGGIPRNLLGDLPYSEARYGWIRAEIPLAGGDDWVRSASYDGPVPPHVFEDLKIETRATPMATQGATSMATDGRSLYCAALDGDRLFRSPDGVRWIELGKAAGDLPGSHPAWINGMMSFCPKMGDRGGLVLRRRFPGKDKYGHDRFRLALFDLAGEKWSWLGGSSCLGHGTTVAGSRLFGLAHALGGNFGGPLCCLDLSAPGKGERRSVISSINGSSPSWFSRAAQLAAWNGLVYGIKNDWTTPQPASPDEAGDRLYAFDPADFEASLFSRGDPWRDRNWKAAATPARDLGPLPFEAGHGAALVALPPRWSRLVGREGGLFITAGCSPSNHEGYGTPSTRFAIYDIASRTFHEGDLPAATGTGTSAVRLGGALFVKRGGMNYGPSNSELFVISPLSEREGEILAAQDVERPGLEEVDFLTIQFDSIGHEPFRIWIDGLRFE